MSLHVLIVDDHAGFRTVARRVLEAAGFQVAGEVSTGRDALLAVAAGHPDVVLLDVQLADISGFVVSRQLRLTAPDVRVVLCSVRAAHDYGDEIAQCGAAGFLPKSRFSAALLTEILDRG